MRKIELGTCSGVIAVRARRRDHVCSTRLAGSWLAVEVRRVPAVGFPCPTETETRRFANGAGMAHVAHGRDERHGT